MKLISCNLIAVKRNLLLLINIFFSFTILFAVPANSEPIEKTQSDGTVVTVRLRGDEKINWIESLDGYTLMYNGNQDIVFAIKDDAGDLQPSKILYKGENLNAYSPADRDIISSITKYQGYSERQVQLLRQFWSMAGGTPNAPNAPSNATAPKGVPTEYLKPVLGEKKVLCILANFSNKKIVKSNEEIDNLMNQVGYKTDNMGSVKDFYRANSYGKMDIAITVVGPVELPETTTYYSKSNQVGFRIFAKTVAEIADTIIDYTQFEMNGVVPAFHILFAGYGDEFIGNGQQIWSHAWNFVEAIGSNLNLDGIDIIRYSCSPTLEGSTGERLTSVGVICHEMAHSFGSPDYYDVGLGDAYLGTGYWDLMANGVQNNGGMVPAQFNMLQKIIFGWVEPIELTGPATITDMPNSVDSAMAYIVINNSINDMYILENRQRKGFDMAVPGTGLLIYHVHPDAITKPNDYGNSGHPQRLYIVAASRDNAFPANNPASYGNINSAAATFGNTKTEFTSTSAPRMFYWGGSNNQVVVNNKPITNIKHENSLISFNFMGGDSTVKTNDAALIDFVAMPKVQDTGLVDIKVKLQNLGKPLTSATIEWTFDGQNQSEYQWSGNLEYNAGTVVTVGSVGMDTGAHTVTATVTIVDDNNTANNAISKTVKLATVFFKEDFEGESLGWINHSDSLHKWMTGNAVANGGKKSLYVTDNNKDNKYNNKSPYSQCSHIFHDIDFPASNDSFDMFFDVRCLGENYQSVPYDYAELWIVPINTENAENPKNPKNAEPVAGVPVTEGELLGKYSNIDNWKTIHKTLPASYSNTSNRLVISWINNDFAGNQPPAAIDNIIFAARSFKQQDTVPSALEPAVEVRENMPLYARISNGTLQVSGLTVGERWYIYSVSGNLIYSDMAIKPEAAVTSNLLNKITSGIYIVKSGKRTTKFVKL
jgi:M6 family metalloprotease-like protein